MGGTTAPSHSLLTPPAKRQPINTHRPPSPSRYRANGNRRRATPRGSETLPLAPPRAFYVQWGRQGVGLMPLLARPRDPHPLPEPFIRPGDLNKGLGYRTLVRGLNIPPPALSASTAPPALKGSGQKERRGAGHCSKLREEQEIVGPPRWVCPGSSSCLRKLQLEP